MASKYLTCAETAKLVRAALKEAFAGIKFSVKSHTYSGGASIHVRWIDGPNEDQVRAVAKRFEGSYFDSGIDYKGSVYHMVKGETVHFGANFIFCERDYSDLAIQAAINAVYRKYEGNFRKDEVAKPTIEQFRQGKLWNMQLSGLHVYGDQSVQIEIGRVLHKKSDRMRVDASSTAASVFVTHDDGYSRSSGSGMSAVAID